jgi:O-antigen/teichoic acid export membrane protein
MLPSYLLETVMIIERRAVQAALTFAGSEAVKMVAVVGPAVMGGGIRGILWGCVLHALLRVIVMAWYLRGVGWPADTLSWATVRRHWAYATPLGVSALICLVQVSADQYVVSSVYGAAIFAVYAVGLFQLPVVELVGTVTASTFMVELARLRGGSEPGAPIELWHRVTARLAAVCFPVCAFAVVWAPELISVLFTDAYRASIPIFRVVACGALLAPLLTDAVLRVYADTAWILRVNLVKLLLTAVFVPAAVAWGSLAGIALVGVVITALGKGLMLKRIGSCFHARGAGLLPWSALAVIGLTAVGCLLPAVWASSVWATSPAGSLGIGLIVYGVVYAVVSANDWTVRRYATRAIPCQPLPTEREAP